MQYLRKRNKQRSLIAASAGRRQDGLPQQEHYNGIVPDHAYAVLRLKEINGFKMVKFRNPWGHFEWTGNWSDSSPLWQQHEQVKTTLQHVRSRILYLLYKKHFLGVKTYWRERQYILVSA